LIDIPATSAVPVVPAAVVEAVAVDEAEPVEEEDEGPLHIGGECIDER
jgi:hypothetical protein